MPELSPPNFSEAFRRFMGSHIIQLQLPTLRQILARFDTNPVVNCAATLAHYLVLISPFTTSWEEAHRKASEFWNEMLSPDQTRGTSEAYGYHLLYPDHAGDISEAERSYLLGMDLSPIIRELRAAIELLGQAGWSRNRILSRFELTVRMVLDPRLAESVYMGFAQWESDPAYIQYMEQEYTDPEDFTVDWRARDFAEDFNIPLDTFCNSHVRKPDDESCPICFEKSPDTIKLRECKHIFCRECISVWVNGNSRGGTKKCPICRSKLTI